MDVKTISDAKEQNSQIRNTVFLNKLYKENFPFCIKMAVNKL